LDDEASDISEALALRCSAMPHAQVRVVLLGAAAAEPSEEGGSLRPDGCLVPRGYRAEGTLFNEPLAAWVDAAGRHFVKW
jgi:hypothetical protein